MGVFSAVAGNNEVPFSSRCTTKSIAKKSPTVSVPPAAPLAITPTFRPWTHTSDDSYIYQLSLVVATATVSLVQPALFYFERADTAGCRLITSVLLTQRRYCCTRYYTTRPHIYTRQTATMIPVERHTRPREAGTHNKRTPQV